jgi:multidrug efflux pump
MNITEISVHRPVFAWMMMAAIIVVGLVAIQRIGISQFPDVDFPTITVSVNWEGAAPEIVETDIVEILEEALVQVEGVKSITSSSRQGSGRITVELDLSRNVDLALQDVQTKISQAQRRLPTDIDPPVISKTNPEDQPIMWVALSGPFPQRVLSDYVRFRVKERLQTVPGVGELMLGGSLERNIRIWLDADRLNARGLTVSDVMRTLRQQHVELPAGRIETVGREINVRVLGEALDLETFGRIVIGNAGGSPIALEDVAIVEDGFEDVRRMARMSGVPAQGLGIKKQRGSNAVAVAQGVRAALVEIQETLPEGMLLAINFDSTRFVEESIHEIRFELILSVILTALICWLFLGSLSSTLVVVLAIPMSLLGTIAVIYFLGFTLNTFTLLAIALAVGIVVDDAIMVLENIFRHGEKGKNRVQAALDGTQQIKFAALAATIAVIAIFFPVVFMEGVIGKFFLQFGIALCVAILISYLEAITLAPARCAQFLETDRKGRGRIGRSVDAAFEGLSKIYRRALDVALARPLFILGAAGLLFVGSFLVVKQLPAEFVPSQDQSRLMIRLHTAVGSNLEETDRAFQQAEDFINSQPEVLRAFAVVGGFGGGSVNTGVMFVTLVPPKERKVTQNEFAALIRLELNGYAGLRATVMDLSQSGFSARRGFPVEFSVRGADWDRLVELSEETRVKLIESGLMVDVDSNYELGMPEIRIIPDRALAADLGVPIEDVALTLSSLVGGMRVGKYSTEGRRVDVRMRLLAEQRTRPEDLSSLFVRTSQGALVPLSSLVTYDERPALQAISREDRERAISISANIAPGHAQDEAIAFVNQLGKDMPVGYRLVLGGASVAFQESMSSLFFALFLGIVFAYMVLASQFNSFLHPVTVLTILPLSIVGAVGALWVTGNSLNIFSMIGLLLTLGIVKKNSIILVDYANQAMAKGQSALEAMKTAGPVRLRPILMTSMATITAALPPAIGLGAGSEIRTPMALAVIGGMAVSTALSLFVVPAFYVVADKAVRKVLKRGPVEVNAVVDEGSGGSSI